MCSHPVCNSFAPMPTRAQSFVFLLITLFLCSWHLDSYHNDNTMARAATVASVVDRGTIEITPVHEVTGDKSLVDGRYYSDKAPLPTFLVLPFHWLSVQLGLVVPGEHGTLTDGLLQLGGFLCGAVPFALLVLLAWQQLKARNTRLPMNAALLAALPFFGSFLFVYAGSFYNHIIGALFSVLAARRMVNKHYVMAGLWGGAAFLSDPALLLFTGVWGLQLVVRRNWKGALLVGVGLIPAVLGSMVHNLAVTGQAFVFPNAFAVNYGAMHQQYGFGTWQPEAFLHLLISDYRGLFFYMPFLLLGLWVLPRTMTGKDLLNDPYVLPAVLLIGLFLTHATWWGGWTYGPRYLTGSAALLTFAILQRIGTHRVERIATPVLMGFGLLCAFSAKVTVLYDMPTGVMHPFNELVIPKLMAGVFSPMQWPVWFGLSATSATLLYICIFVLGTFALLRVDRNVKNAPVPLS